MEDTFVAEIFLKLLSPEHANYSDQQIKSLVKKAHQIADAFLQASQEIIQEQYGGDPED